MKFLFPLSFCSLECDVSCIQWYFISMTRYTEVLPKCESDRLLRYLLQADNIFPTKSFIQMSEAYLLSLSIITIHFCSRHRLWKMKSKSKCITFAVQTVKRLAQKDNVSSPKTQEQLRISSAVSQAKHNIDQKHW